MQKLRQVIRLYGQGKGTKAINSMLGVSRNTIKKYLHIFHSSGMSYDSFFGMSDNELSSLFQVNKSPASTQKQLDLESMLPLLCKQLKRKGVTREHLHKQYLEQHPDGFGESLRKKRANKEETLYL
jgi:transposase